MTKWKSSRSILSWSVGALNVNENIWLVSLVWCAYFLPTQIITTSGAVSYGYECLIKFLSDLSWFPTERNWKIFEPLREWRQACLQSMILFLIFSRVRWLLFEIVYFPVILPHWLPVSHWLGCSSVGVGVTNGILLRGFYFRKQVSQIKIRQRYSEFFLLSNSVPLLEYCTFTRFLELLELN